MRQKNYTMELFLSNTLSPRQFFKVNKAFAFYILHFTFTGKLLIIWWYIIKKCHDCHHLSKNQFFLDMSALIYGIFLRNY